ncbi:putative TIM-barrel fold metal-dependent hydrolase [Actinocorallia herbida]|uniref:6-methylsalicylate decarboxylase n=1 Tax=Actinocorallia herbida TaxID=58109 RepID=A0A3N1CZV6_9ACTN|nr:amidohydrolase family protein [Actinocorallia herbida]ROO86811.1 putative TIM-barrel fold metal-dependent hydrolase [Actinocorallia herbida]
MPTDPTALIDVHAHFVTDAYVAAARAAGHEHPDGMPSWPSWAAAAHVAFMDGSGIGKALLSISSPGTHFGDDAAARELSRHVNEHAAQARAQHPGRFGHLAALPLPDVEGSIAEARHALDVLAADGVAILSNHLGVYPGDSRFEPLWAELDRRGAIVFVHPTSPPQADAVALGRPRPMVEFLFDSARAAADLLLSGALARHGRIRWIFTHCGGVLPPLTERLDLFRFLLPVPPGASDAASRDQFGDLWHDLAGTPFPHQAPALAAAFGSERLLYGSDSCWTPDFAVTAQIHALDAAPPLPDTSSWRDLTTRNAHRLLARNETVNSVERPS